MKIAIDISPLSSGHSVRGVGFYLKNLLAALKKYHPEHEYMEFTGSGIPQNADIIHYPYFDPFFLHLPFFSNKPVVVTVHDLTPLVLHNLFPVGLKGMLKWRMQCLALKNVSRIITDSIASKKDIEHFVGMQSTKIDAIYLAAGEHFGKRSKAVVDKVRKKYNLPQAFALYVGDVTPNKNILRLLQACIQIHVPLVIVGKVFTDLSIDTSHSWLQELVDVREIAEKHKDLVQLLGFVADEDLVTIYNSASVFVMPSLYEGFGLPICEAFACGTPVVCSDKGSLPEIAGNAALLVDPLNVGEIAKAIEKVIKNQKIGQELSEKGMQQVKNFSWQKTADATVASYKKVLSS